jgi:hypothetical protein
MIERSYNEHKSDIVAGNLSQCTNRYEQQIEILKSSRKIIHKDTGEDNEQPKYRGFVGLIVHVFN